MPSSPNAPLLSVNNLNVSFDRHGETVQAVAGVSFTLHKGESLGIVGESGSGKSVSVMSLLGLNRRNGTVTGEAVFDGRDLLKLGEEDLRKVRGRTSAWSSRTPCRASTRRTASAASSWSRRSGTGSPRTRAPGRRP